MSLEHTSEKCLPDGQGNFHHRNNTEPPKQFSLAPCMTLLCLLRHPSAVCIWNRSVEWKEKIHLSGHVSCGSEDATKTEGGCFGECSMGCINKTGWVCSHFSVLGSEGNEFTPEVSILKTPLAISPTHSFNYTKVSS